MNSPRPSAIFSGPKRWTKASSCRRRTQPRSGGAPRRRGTGGRVGARVEGAVLHDEAKPPSLVGLEGVAELFPSQRPAVDDDVVGPALLPAPAPHQAAGHLVLGQEPARPVGIGLQVAAGHLGLGVGPQLTEQIADVGVVGAKDGELEALAGRSPGLLQLHHDARRCPPRARLHAVAATVGPGEDERRRRCTKLRQTGQSGHPAIRAAVAERRVAETDANVPGGAVHAGVAGHAPTLRAVGRSWGRPAAPSQQHWRTRPSAHPRRRSLHVPAHPGSGSGGETP